MSTDDRDNLKEHINEILKEKIGKPSTAYLGRDDGFFLTGFPETKSNSSLDAYFSNSKLIIAGYVLGSNLGFNQISQNRFLQDLALSERPDQMRDFYESTLKGILQSRIKEDRANGAGEIYDLAIAKSKEDGLIHGRNSFDSSLGDIIQSTGRYDLFEKVLDIRYHEQMVSKLENALYG